jgi:hypothetical protein
MKNNYNIKEGLESLKRIKLMMGYDLSKTLDENKKINQPHNLLNENNLILEQEVNSKNTKDYPSCVQKYGPPREEYLYSGFYYMIPPQSDFNYNGYKFASGGVNPEVITKNGSRDSYFCDRWDLIRFGEIYKLSVEDACYYLPEKELSDKGRTITCPPSERFPKGKVFKEYEVPKARVAIQKSKVDPNYRITAPSPDGYIDYGNKFTWRVSNRMNYENLTIVGIEFGELTAWPQSYNTNFTKGIIKPGYYGTVNVIPTWNVEHEYIGGSRPEIELKIFTNKGMARTKLRDGDVKYETQEERKYRELKTNYEGRKSSTGVPVPDYFDPASYDTFIDEVQKSCGLSAMFDTYVVEPLKKGSAPSPDDLSDIPADCINAYRTLYNKYRNSKFPSGINPDFKQKFNNEFSKAKSALEKFKETHKVQMVKEPYSWYFDKWQLSNKDRQTYENLKKEFERVKSFWGYDDRNWFDKLWDEWGTYIQVGLGVLTVIITGGLALIPESIMLSAAAAMEIGGTLTTVQSVVNALNATQKAMVAADIAMNVALGTYQFANGEDEEAIMSFFFACLPKIHTIYGKIGNVFKTVDEVAAKSLAQKFAGFNIKSAQDLNAVLKTLPESEAQILKKTYLELSPEIVTDAVTEFQKKIDWKGFAKTVVKAVPHLAGSLIVDFTVLKGVQQIYSKSVELIDKYCNCVTTPEEKRKMKTYLNKLSEAQMVELGKVLNNIQMDNTLNDPQKAKVTIDVLEGGLENFEGGINESNLEKLKKKYKIK